jgi:hypothetical protein
MGFKSFHGSVYQLRMIGQTEVVIGAKIQNFLAAFQPYLSALGGYYYSFILKKSCFFYFTKLILKMLLYFSVHNL